MAAAVLKGGDITPQAAFVGGHVGSLCCPPQACSHMSPAFIASPPVRHMPQLRKASTKSSALPASAPGLQEYAALLARAGVETKGSAAASRTISSLGMAQGQGFP
jgi:hypothetical protein